MRKPKKIREIVCFVCGKTFETRGSSVKYCGAKCFRKSVNDKYVPVIVDYKIKCNECGDVFTTTQHNDKYCSNDCRKKHKNRAKDINRRHRLRENGTIHWDISLSKLVKRDKGLCHICHNKVDMKADSNNDSYGSVDHVLPVCKGGTHTWDNVKLAHRGCNTLKRDKDTYESENGQLTMAI